MSCDLCRSPRASAPGEHYVLTPLRGFPDRLLAPCRIVGKKFRMARVAGRGLDRPHLVLPRTPMLPRSSENRGPEGCSSDSCHPRKKPPRAQRLSSSWAHGGWKPKEINLAQLNQSVKSKSKVFPVVTVAFNPEVSPKPYLVGISFLASLRASW